jgi:acyl-CoA synthetase (AMP-forming)/AMP-acid ligase II
VLKQNVERCDNREFLRFKDGVVGYADFDYESDQVAAGLESIGVGRGDVAIMMNNRPEFISIEGTS